MLIKLNGNISIKQIADSGQCFRMLPIGNGRYSCVYKGKYVEITQVTNNIISLSCTQEDFDNYWKDYLDLETDYEAHKERIISLGDINITKSVRYGSGIRILRQDPFETLISFIISQRNSIPRIMNTIDKMCKLFGEEFVDESTNKVYRAFPTMEAILIADENGMLDKVSLGYRQRYVVLACETLLNKPNDWITGKNARENIMQLLGVGKKVADCYMLFALHEMDSFPIDTWIQKIIGEYQDRGEELSIKGCEDIGGLIQQYLFFAVRGA